MAQGDFKAALGTTNEIELAVKGRVTGRESTRPVWFVQHDDKLYLLPVTGTDSQWYKNLLTTPEMGLSAAGADYHASGVPITDPADVRRVVDDFRGKYGAKDVAAYYPNPDVAVEVPLT